MISMATCDAPSMFERDSLILSFGSISGFFHCHLLNSPFLRFDPVV